MKRLFAALALLAMPAWAEEKIEILRTRPIHSPTEDRLMLIGKTTKDAQFVADPLETRVFTLRCNYPGRDVAHGRLITSKTFHLSFNRDTSRIIVGSDPGEIIRINRETMSYYVMRKKFKPDDLLYERVTEIGVCKEVP